MKSRISRWHYSWGYFSLFILLMLAMWSNDNGFDYFASSFFTLSAIVLLLLEISIRQETVLVSKKGLRLKKGLFGGTVTRLSHDSIARVSIHQHQFQRFFDYGDVRITTEKGEILLRNIDSISRFARAISKREE